MPREKDPFWKYTTSLNENNSKWRCNFCGQEHGGRATRIKAHLAGLTRFGIKGCERVDANVRAEARVALMPKKVTDSSDQGVSEERIPGNVRAAPTSTTDPPNAEGGNNLQLPQGMPPLTQNHELMEEMGQEMRVADIANPSFDGATSNYSAPPPPNSPFDEVLTWIESFDLETSNAQQNPDSQLSNMATTSTPQHSSQPLQSDRECGYGTGLEPLIPSLPSTGPLIVESVDPLQIPEDITNTIGPWTSEGEGTSCSMMALAEEVRSPFNLPWQPQCSIQSQMPMNFQQIPAGVSSFQYNQLPATGNSHCLQGSNQHSQLQTPMDIDASIASRHTSDPPIVEDTIDDLQVPKAATNTTGPSSSQDMNRCSPTMNLRSIYADDGMIRNLKRKVEELDDKEAVIKEDMEIEFAASSVRKKPRILVERWLKETERARNNFQIIGQANAETLPPKEQVETLTREVEELIGKTLPQTLLIEERDAKGVKLLERKLTGDAIHRNIELIWDHLTKNHGCKLGIYGMGGVGKTTIMRHIHNRLLEDATFDGVVFITVSKDFSIYKMQSDIGKALKCGVMNDEDEKKRAAMLSEHLESKKNCVLILDDVWESIDLEEMGIPIRAAGLKMVLTTRSFDVCRQMQCQEKIKIEPLSQEEAESLFLEELGPEVPLNLEIEAIVKSIVTECAGLPIGVIMMARSMRGVTKVFEWRDSLMKLKSSCKGQMDMEKKVITNLKFSYDRLGNLDVQQCFLSCALYSKILNTPELIEFFIDEGLIGGLNTRKEQYDRGLAILKTLKNVCLLEDHSFMMTMHDLIRDMALHIMSATSIVEVGKQLRNIPPDECWTDALEKVSLMNNSFIEFPSNMSPNCPKLSTLLLNQCLLGNVVIPNSFFKNLSGLKVLNLSKNDMTELPNFISDLVNLRALILRDCTQLCRIPPLGKLTFLRKLDARNCKSLKALEGLEMLVNLRYLDLTKTRVERLPKGTLDGLRNLQYLNVWEVNAPDITKLGALEEFRFYPENWKGFNKCVRAIEQINNRYYYNLRVMGYDLDYNDEWMDLLEACMIYNDIEKQREFIVEVSDDAQFTYGRTVVIWKWNHAIVHVGGECIGTFILIPQDVRKMRIEKCGGITNLSDAGLLGDLEELKIIDCIWLQELCGGQDKKVIDIHDSFAPTPTPPLFPNLRVLKIWTCPKLKYLFGHGFKSNLLHLRKIEILECKEMVGIIAAVTSPPPDPLPFFPSLEQIYVNRCGLMKRAVEYEWMPHFPNLRGITVSNCEKTEEIIGGPPPNVPVEEISLEYLEVYSCNNMRKLFPHEWLCHLRNLKRINVESCKGMVEMISGAGQGQEESIVTPVNNTPSSFQPPISLPKLERLNLRDLPQLKSICEVPISCDLMKSLSVYECPKLKGIPLQLQLREIEDLRDIWIDDEEMWKTLIWDHPNAQTILQPYLRKAKHPTRPYKNVTFLSI